MNDLFQILTASAGSLGFGMLFRMRKKRLLWAALGGGLTWSVFLLCDRSGMNAFFSNLIAAVFAALWAEALAHRQQVPSQIYTITAFVPLIPGSLLYKTMAALAAHDPAAAELGTSTATTAAALAFGTLLLTVMKHIVAGIRGRKARQSQ